MGIIGSQASWLSRGFMSPVMRKEEVILTLKCMDDHKVVDFWSVGKTVHFQIFVGGLFFTRCLS